MSEYTERMEALNREHFAVRPGTVAAFGLFHLGRWPNEGPHLADRLYRVCGVRHDDCYPHEQLVDRDERWDAPFLTRLGLAMIRAERIVFDLSGLDPERTRRQWDERCWVTTWELREVLTHECLFGKTEFYRDGERVDPQWVRETYDPNYSAAQAA